jgi:hypothetical protein
MPTPVLDKILELIESGEITASTLLSTAGGAESWRPEPIFPPSAVPMCKVNSCVPA